LDAFSVLSCAKEKALAHSTKTMLSAVLRVDLLFIRDLL
jgi:hypothetical protein